MPPPDQFFQRLLRDSFDDARRSPTPRVSSSWSTSSGSLLSPSSFGTPSRIRNGNSAARVSGNTTSSSAKLQAGVVGVRSSNLTTPHRTVSQRDNPLSNASSSSAAPQRQDGRIAAPDSQRNTVMHGATISPFGGRQHGHGNVGQRRGGSLPDSERPLQLLALEHVLEDEMEQLRLLTEAVEQRIEKVMTLDEQRQAILRAAQRQQLQRQVRRNGSNNDLQVSSAGKAVTSGEDVAEDQSLFHYRDSVLAASSPARVVDLSTTSRFSPRSSAQRTPKTPQGSTTRCDDDNIGVLASMDGVTPLTTSPRVGRRLPDVKQTDGDLFVVNLANDNDASAQRGGSSDTDIHPRSDVQRSGQGNPQSISALRHSPQREIREQRSVNAKLLLAQTHAAQADVLKYEEDLLSLQDALIAEQRRPQSEDQRSADTLMHLRIVARDELSKCKKRQAVLQQLESQLTKMTEA